MTDLQSMLIAQEGTGPMKDGRYYPYPDRVDKLTIGHGRNLDDHGLSEMEVSMLFSNDIADAIGDARLACGSFDTLSRPRQLVLCSMAFNLGRHRLTGFVKFLSAIGRQDWDTAAAEILNSEAATEAVDRYRTLAAMMKNNSSVWV